MDNNFYFSVIDQLPMPFMCLKASRNDDHEIIDFLIYDLNDAFLGKTGLNRAELAGKHFSSVFSHRNPADDRWMVYRASSLKAGDCLETIRYCKLLQGWYKGIIFNPEKNYYTFLYQDISLEKLAKTISREVQMHHKFLFRLTSSPHYNEGNIYDFITMLTPMACEVFNISRAGVWFFDEDGEKLRCYDNYESYTRQHTSGELLAGIRYNNEFHYLSKHRYIASEDAINDDRLKGFREAYLIPNQITSLLDVGINSGGTTKGVICFEQKNEKKKWKRYEISFACQLADQIAVVLELFEKKIAQNQLIESQARIKSIFLTAPSGIGVVKNRILQEVNDRICQMSGYSREELIGKSARILYPDQQQFDYVGKEKYRQIEQMGTGTVQTQWKTRDGKIIDVLLSSAPIDPEDLSGGITFTATDNTDRFMNVHLQHELSEALKNAESTRKLLSGLGQQMHTPLMCILGVLELLANAKTELHHQEYLKVMQDAGESLMEILNRAINYSGSDQVLKKTL